MSLSWKRRILGLGVTLDQEEWKTIANVQV